MMMGVHENICLLVLSDDDSPKWLNNWLHGYPTSIMQLVFANQSIQDWCETLNQAYLSIPDDEEVMLVAAGIGVNAAVCWYYHAAIWQHKTIAGMILVAPDWSHISVQETAFQAACFHHPTALIMLPENDEDALLSAKSQAYRWRAKLFIHQPDGVWSWGMKLMQEMLLA